MTSKVVTILSGQCQADRLSRKWHLDARARLQCSLDYSSKVSEMALIRLTRSFAYSAGMDAANRSMRAAGRTAWNDDDANLACSEFNRLWPLCEHGVDQEECFFCFQTELQKESRSHPSPTPSE
jgi:hypothetical protein